jgi:ergothioneine biosynthesis protein EgtB
MGELTMDTKRDSLCTSYQETRRQTEQLCQPLAQEDYMPQPIADVSPPRWHLGHTTWFFEAVILREFVAGYQDYHPRYAYLFNSYYQSLGSRWERAKRGHLSRPTVAEVYAFRAAIDERMLALITTCTEAYWSKLKSLVTIGLHHEQQHQELLLTDLKYILCQNPLHPVYQDIPEHRWPKVAQPANLDAWVEFSGGNHTIGYTGNGFFFDNERPVHTVYVMPFRLRKYLVTNREYLEFIDAGGYRDFRYWLDEGWTWLQTEAIQQPLYWEHEDGQWHHMTLHGYMPLDPDAPVTHISYYEAAAFATWAGKRLATEFEWEVAAKEALSDPAHGQFQDDGIYQPRPPCPAETLDRLCQQLGTVWEWTQSGYLPYPGYKPVAGALGEYNGKFMSNQMVLRGGSCATPRQHIRYTYRNFFHPDKQWQFTGIRLADAAPS